ncbi:hypothetical protein RZS08_58140, partial [Arthrospira platensis SPKY1]|nr:hypothetical protein [Arthrospira platensis SPKY1]
HRAEHDQTWAVGEAVVAQAAQLRGLSFHAALGIHAPPPSHEKVRSLIPLPDRRNALPTHALRRGRQ